VCVCVCACVCVCVHNIYNTLLFFLDEYKTARLNLGKAEITSDFASEAEIVGKRIKKPNKKYNSSSDSSEENDRFKKSSVRISKTSNKKQSKKECISKSIEVSSNSTDSEANETSHLMAKDVGSSQLQVPNSLHKKSKKILQKVSHSHSTKSTAGHSQRSLYDHSSDNKSTKGNLLLLFRIVRSSVTHDEVFNPQLHIVKKST